MRNTVTLGQRPVRRLAFGGESGGHTHNSEETRELQKRFAALGLAGYQRKREKQE